MYSPVVLLALLACATALPSFQRIDPNASWRVVGGTPAPATAHRSIVSMRRGTSHSCGGTIINSRWILTAAHCVVSGLGNVNVLAGTHLLNSGGIVFVIGRGFIHGSYSSATMQNDISVLESVNTISFSAAIQQVALGTATLGGGVGMTLAGWGTTSNGGPIPNNLQQLSVTSITVAQCQASLSPNPITATQICTVSPTGTGACHGDSGGPLFIGTSGTQGGAVSWGIPCGQAFPDVFVRVSSYIPWISSAISQ